MSGFQPEVTDGAQQDDASWPGAELRCGSGCRRVQHRLLPRASMRARGASWGQGIRSRRCDVLLLASCFVQDGRDAAHVGS